ncbi:hypothetical protein KA005_59380, partial [bacterium]|nr:hypothetical protein [bacterium]
MRHAVLLFLATGLFTSWPLWGTNNDVANKWHKSSVSRKHLLGKPRFFKDSDLFDIRSVTGSTTQKDSLSIVGIRVQFQADEDEMTTGNGQFDLSISTEPIINPPPHDRSYFENQLKALSHY